MLVTANIRKLSSTHFVSKSAINIDVTDTGAQSEALQFIRAVDYKLQSRILMLLVGAFFENLERKFLKPKLSARKSNRHQKQQTILTGVICEVVIIQQVFPSMKSTIARAFIEIQDVILPLLLLRKFRWVRIWHQIKKLKRRNESNFTMKEELDTV